MHEWTWADDIIVLFVKRHGCSRLGAASEREVARLLGIPWASFAKRMGNFEYQETDGRKGLSQCARQTVDVWCEYRERDQRTFLRHLDDARHHFGRAVRCSAQD
ncbi:hypothetical protein [Microvirga splendida]|uniref:Uncharacterized protein n=1 Tax=Microvirga splendida TaxID=2795727 RepID=A0ABS0XXN6_9HYPH|nr:hypothetical protein [Microvirga splendida]MBJ6124814.1 hypothetical protein [Microvirga splendida]